MGATLDIENTKGHKTMNFSIRTSTASGYAGNKLYQETDICTFDTTELQSKFTETTKNNLSL